MTWTELHGTLNGRATCETVAQHLLDTVPLTKTARLEAQRIARARAPWWVTSMSERFDETEPDARPQLEAAAAIIDVSDQQPRAGLVDHTDPDAIRDWVNEAGIAVGGWRAGKD